MEVSSHHAGVVVVPLEGQCRVIVTLNIVSLMLAVFLEWFHFTYDLTTTNLAVCVPPTSPIHCLQLTMSAARADDNDYVSARSHTHFVLSLFLSLHFPTLIVSSGVCALGNPLFVMLLPSIIVGYASGRRVMRTLNPIPWSVIDSHCRL